MNPTSMNEILVDPSTSIAKALLNHLMSIRESANLMIMATSVKEMDWEKSYAALSKAFKEKITSLSAKDQNQLSGCTAILRYRDHDAQCMRGLSITFGKTPEPQVYESSFSHDVRAFINNLPQPEQGMTRYITLPVIRVALLVHSLRSNLDGSEWPLRLEDFALLDFNNTQSWRYSVISSSVQAQYEVKVDSNDLASNSFYLRVSKPRKQMGKKLLETAWMFNNQATGFSFYQTPDLKKLEPNDLKKATYIYTQKRAQGSQEEVAQIQAENLEQQFRSIANHEAYWNSILYDLLRQAGIEFERRLFKSTEGIHVDPKYKGRSYQLSEDFLGVNGQGLLEKGCFTLRYCITQAIYEIEAEHPEASLLAAFEKALQAISLKHQSLPYAVDTHFCEVSSMQEADLVIGQYDTDKSWKSAADLAAIDAYGHQKIADLMEGRLNRKQFIQLDRDFSVEKLERAVSECFLKRWITTPQASKRITLQERPPARQSNYLVLFSNKKKQATEDKPRKVNSFHCCFQFEISGDQLLFSQPEVIAELSQVAIKNNNDKLDFTDYYWPYADDRLTQLTEVLELIDQSNQEEIILKALKPCYLNNDTALYFEYQQDRLLSIWASQPQDLWIAPALDDFFSSKATFAECIQQGLEAKAYTKSRLASRVTHDKRLSNDPHYQVMVEGCTVIIQRKRFNQNKKIDRHKLRQFTRIYPAQPIASPEEYGFLIAGLLTPEAGAFKDSGVAQNIYEKICGLLI